MKLGPAEAQGLAQQVAPHRLVWRPPGTSDPTTAVEAADILFGQPELERCLTATPPAWTHLNSAGWDRFNVPRVRDQFTARGAMLSTSSSVYSEPCAQHVLSLLLADARQLPRSIRHQATDHAWPQHETRAACTLLGPEATVLLVGFASIATRLVELLSPFGVRIVGVRRTPTGKEPVPTVATRDLLSILPEADHIINLLPGGAETKHTFNTALFTEAKPSAAFYNIGRGSTVDQNALLAALQSGRLRAAYLDVTDPEPLPTDHPLWRETACTITPHSAGGHANETARLVAHFLRNLARFANGEALVDRVL